MPLGSLLRTTRLSILAGVGSNASPCRDDRAALVAFHQLRGVGRGGDLGPVRRLGGNELAQRAVGRLEVCFGDAQHILGRDFLDFVALVVDQPPIAGCGIFAEDQAEVL